MPVEFEGLPYMSNYFSGENTLVVLFNAVCHHVLAPEKFGRSQSYVFLLNTVAPFSDRVPLRGPVLAPHTPLFPEKSFKQISFDQNLEN